MPPTSPAEEFERMIIAYALNDLSRPDLERWAYEHADDLISEVDGDAGLALLEANFASDKSVVDALNPWFRKRFPNAFNGFDLRSLRGSHMSKQFKDRVLRSLV